ncbi:hypothetical protein Cus16_0094 [Curtobacterium sp. ER1/6]|nr:hypothetical protein Cus16_0094 [Curtobacterium sp. ER1/6]
MGGGSGVVERGEQGGHAGQGPTGLAPVDTDPHDGEGDAVCDRVEDAAAPGTRVADDDHRGLTRECCEGRDPVDLETATGECHDSPASGSGDGTCGGRPVDGTAGDRGDGRGPVVGTAGDRCDGRTRGGDGARTRAVGEITRTTSEGALGSAWER